MVCSWGLGAAALHAAFTELRSALFARVSQRASRELAATAFSHMHATAFCSNNKVGVACAQLGASRYLPTPMYPATCPSDSATQLLIRVCCCCCCRLCCLLREGCRLGSSRRSSREALRPYPHS